MYSFLVSQRSHWRPKDSCPSVRTYVPTSVTLLLENRSLLFSETLQLVRPCKCEKNVPSAFLKKNPGFAHFGQKLSKIGHFGPKCPKMEVFHIFFSQSVHYNLIIFCTKPSLWSRKKITFSYFLGKFKNGPFWTNLGHFLLKRSVIYCLWFSIKFIYFA